jgi:hypothetical protein
LRELEDNCRKSLVGSIKYQQTIMIHTKRVIFMILPLLFVPVVYSISSTPDACALPPDKGWDMSKDCYDEPDGDVTCCWEEPDIMNPGETITWCQSCGTDRDTGEFNCGPVASPAPSPTAPFTPHREVLNNHLLLHLLLSLEKTPMFRQLEVLNNHLRQLRHKFLQDYPVEVQVHQLKEGLQNNQLLHRMTKEKDCLLSKTRRMSHLAVV